MSLCGSRSLCIRQALNFNETLVEEEEEDDDEVVAENSRQNGCDLNITANSCWDFDGYEEYLNSSTEDHSHSPNLLLKSPRKCQRFVSRISLPNDAKPDMDINMDDGTGLSGTRPGAVTPPYKRVRALRLFDAPQTPKTLLQQSHCSRIEKPFRPTPIRNRVFSSSGMGSIRSRGSLIGLPEDKRFKDKPVANVNPFTLSERSYSQSGVKRRRTKSSLNG